MSREVTYSVRARTNNPGHWTQERPTVQKLLVIGHAVDQLLLNPATAGEPTSVWAAMEPLAHQVGLHFQAFQLATMRVCERLNIDERHT